MDADLRASPVGLAVLGLLFGGPLHPYRMQRLLKDWGKDQVINVGQRANLYKTIKRLHEAGLIAVRQTERDHQYPERTIYELTEPGRLVALRWLTDMISSPRNEYPQFPAALSFAMLLGPERAVIALQQRAEALRGTLAGFDHELTQYAQVLPRVTLLETEYQRAAVSAELIWVEGIVDDLRTGSLTWTSSDFANAAEAYDHD